MAIKIERVEPGSEAEALGLAPGDELLAVDENELNDSLDYDFYTDSSSFHLKARVADGIREWDVQRAERGPFGCDFSTYLGDQKHSCSNHCMFCFIDQLPPGMRESLYFKDDDERLSFLFGNYITMTNMQDHEIDRIIKMHISPINISVHTTNPQLRVRMLANKRGGEVLKYLPRLVQGGIAVNCQLVLCRGINDGDELRRTLADLLEIESSLSDVQYQIESWQSQLDWYSNQVSCCTVYITLNEVETLTPTSTSFGAKLLAALRNGWTGFVSGAQAVAVFLVGAWPAILIGAVCGMIYYRVRHPRKKK